MGNCRGQSEDRSWPGGGLRRAHRRSRSPSGYLDIWSFKDSDTKFVQLVNSVPHVPLLFSRIQVNGKPVLFDLAWLDCV